MDQITQAKLTTMYSIASERLTLPHITFLKAYEVNHLARADSVVEANPGLVVRVLASGQDVLVAPVVWPLVDHPGPALHPG